jgi:hypothetical protein
MRAVPGFKCGVMSNEMKYSFELGLLTLVSGLI